MVDKYVSLMQPHFFPAFSYFEFISRSNKFVFLTEVQLSRQSFQTRNRILVSNEVKWINSSVIRRSSSKLICDAKFSNLFWKASIIKTLKLNYSRSQYKNDLKDIIYFLEKWNSVNLCEFNISLIKFVINRLHINTEVMLDSDIELPSDRTLRIIELMKMNPEYNYLYSPGSKEYMFQDNIFNEGFKCAEFKYKNLFYETESIRLSFIEALSTFGWVGLKIMLGNQSDIKITSIRS